MKKMLTSEQLDFFEENGYLVIEDVIDDETVEAITAEYATLLNQIADEKIKTGLLSKSFLDMPFDEKYLELLYTEDNFFDQIDITLPLANDFPANATMHAGPAVFSLLTHPNLLDVVEAIMGPEIYSNPVQHVRIKPPRQALPERAGKNSYVGTTTWHQDHAALNNKTERIRWSFDLRWNPIGHPTGRPAFPGFVARSQANPENELHDPLQWKKSWDDAKERIVSGHFSDQIFNAERWLKNSDLEICA